jgi:LPPG:FO 2-phospho-L-lactate transferase
MQLTHIVALAGGVGGAKLALGLQAALPPGALTVVVNTGDDFEHWGLTICPDLDTVVYNLAGVNNPAMGWGRDQESFRTLETMSQLGGEDWFRVGDQDMALHLRRSEWLQQGISLSEITDRLRRAFGIPSTVLPMSDDPVRTLIHTDEGDLPFQHYFVRLRCEPMVMDMSFVGAEAAKLSDAVIEAISTADLIVFCPSNPYLSIDPILSIPGMRRLLQEAPAPKLAVSPIVGGAAIKGPAAKMMRELGQMVSPLTVADHFDGLLDGFVMDEADAEIVDAVQLPTLVTPTLMTDLASKKQLAEDILAFGAQLAEKMNALPDSGPHASPYSGKRPAR